MKPRKWNAPGRGDGARAVRLGGYYRQHPTARCALAQAAPPELLDALGDAQRELQNAVAEALARGATCELRTRVLNAEAALGAARFLVGRALNGGTPC